VARFSWEGIFKWILIVILAIAVVIWVISQFLDKLTKAFEAYKKSGLSFTFSHKKRTQIKRRKIFCAVLRSDLATLAKAENWNDQYFTDLEAEIEAEGGYYATILHRLFKRRSYGLRRVPSLIQAIESSTEPAILLVGNPGSGKSVALRHLAHQLAEQGIKSGDPKAKIPLYVNLKELAVYRQSNLNADFIKQFVLDNIRRGDADTAAYVRENWDDYRERGIWVFLFDSFDEIPDVLHAPTGSPIIRQYTEAIRQFLEGMSSCQSLLASREFKGPDVLPWQKFRILPLSEQRQDQLINNSFLKPEQKEIVRQHLAVSSSNLRDNPLFLTLLCRYVKDENRPPANDHDLLSRHIDRLAHREPDYIERKYRLSPTDLISGAIQIAALFAENPTLSLAPTQAEIASALARKPLTFPYRDFSEYACGLPDDTA
jgi:hypothetical protein